MSVGARSEGGGVDDVALPCPQVDLGSLDSTDSACSALLPGMPHPDTAHNFGSSTTKVRASQFPGTRDKNIRLVGPTPVGLRPRAL
jgi:hypothetical protein